MAPCAARQYPIDEKVDRVFEIRYPPKTITLLARRINQEARSQEHVDWAVDALVAGFDSDGLRILAGLDWPGPLNRLEVEHYFLRSCNELGLRFPEDELVLREYLNERARAIHDGSADPEQAVEDIHRLVVSRLDHPGDLMPWCYLWEGNSPECAPLEKSVLPSAIRRFAGEWISRNQNAAP